jgi:hypothetical protein
MSNLASTPRPKTEHINIRRIQSCLDKEQKFGVIVEENLEESIKV